MTLPALRKFLIPWMLSAAIAVAGCGKEEATSVEKSAVSHPAGASGSQSSSGDRPAGSLAVTILPPSPTGNDDLQAVIHGAAGRCCFVWLKNEMSLEGEAGSLLPKHNFKKGDRITIKVEAGNGVALANTVIGNTPPQVTTVSFRDPRVRGGTEIEVVPEGMDPDGDRIGFRYVWSINGEEFGWIDSPVLPADRFRKGDRIGLKVIPFDEGGEGVPFVVEDFVIPNAPPRFKTEPAREFRGFTYKYEARAEDPDGDSLVYTLESAPPGMQIDSGSGNILWAVQKEHAGEHVIKIVAQDQDGMKAVQEYTLAISISEKGEN